jgi:hypothetical protein
MADENDLVQMQTFTGRFQQMAIAPQDALRLDGALRVERGEDAIDDVAKRGRHCP